MTDLPELVDEILLQRRQSALFVTLNRPQAKNALNGAIVSGLTTLCDWLKEQHDVRIVVLRGAGGAFCGGGDIKEFGKMMMTLEPAAGEGDMVASRNRQFGDLLLRLDAMSQVLVTVIEGPCFGGANGFLCVSDVAIAETHARFSLSETTLGIPPAQIGPFLVRRIGLYSARRLALTGAHFGAREAMRIGLVDNVVDGAAGLEGALVETLSAIGRCEPQANAATKQILNRAASFVDPAQLDQAAQDFARCLRDKGREGARAFANKSAAPWIENFAVKKEV
ncbi:enoyl-CoA hydratase/isomerase family protein [Hyphococcus sp.]|uniref:enoyl-CoA hydratase/isomerase family protein n=1 Tax=Hyphococcus sp. TaxID=2038636 RepID=UPI002080FC66|nr:MAG: isohexenylglutaconyl-CoA hydratase [Marinicaulis sp.]